MTELWKLGVAFKPISPLIIIDEVFQVRGYYNTLKSLSYLFLINSKKIMFTLLIERIMRVPERLFFYFGGVFIIHW